MLYGSFIHEYGPRFSRLTDCVAHDKLVSVLNNISMDSICLKYVSARALEMQQIALVSAISGDSTGRRITLTRGIKQPIIGT